MLRYETMAMRRSLAVLLLAAQALTLAHLAIESHVASSLDGAAVHPADKHCAPVAHHGTHELDRGCAHVALAATEACGVVTFVRSTFSLLSGSAAVEPGSACELAQRTGEASLKAPLKVLSVAPKCSPPDANV